jgi:nicotinamide-nucleotide adenylyltransferase
MLLLIMAASEIETHSESFELDPRLEQWFDLFLQQPKDISSIELDTPSQKYGNGLIIGRFQPLHYGHIYLITQALNICNKISIGIGSVNPKPGDIDNPFPVEVREKILRRELDRYGLTPKITEIVRLNDFGDDQKWFDHVKSLVERFDVVVGNNGWVNEIFKERGIETKEILMLDRNRLQGKEIRGFLRGIGFPLTAKPNYIA